MPKSTIATLKTSPPLLVHRTSQLSSYNTLKSSGFVSRLKSCEIRMPSSNRAYESELLTQIGSLEHFGLSSLTRRSIPLASHSKKPLTYLSRYTTPTYPLYRTETTIPDFQHLQARSPSLPLLLPQSLGNPSHALPYISFWAHPPHLHA